MGEEKFENQIPSEYIEDVRNLGYSYIKQGKYEIALPFFEMLVNVDGDNFYDLQTLGGLYLQLNENEKSIKFLKKALEIKPKNGIAKLNYTKALLSSGYKDIAIEEAKKLKKHKNKTIAKMATALLLAFEKK